MAIKKKRKLSQIQKDCRLHTTRLNLQPFAHEYVDTWFQQFKANMLLGAIYDDEIRYMYVVQNSAA